MDILVDVDELAVGGLLAALLMVELCLHFKGAFLLILSRISVHEHDLLAVDGVATLDAG